MLPSFYLANGEKSAYALSCGHIQESKNGLVRLSCESPSAQVFRVVARNSDGDIVSREYGKLGVMRKLYRELSKVGAAC